MARSTTKVTARARARAAKAKLDAQQRDHERLVEDAVTAYYDADDQRTAALAALAAADNGRATAVTTLAELNETPQRIAVLVELSTTEIRKLRGSTTGTKTKKKTDTDDAQDTGTAAQDAVPDRGTASKGTPDKTAPVEPESEPAPDAAALAS